MKKSIPLLIFALYALPGFTQLNYKVDSLRKLFFGDKNEDTVKMFTAILLADSYRIKLPDSSNYFADWALRLSQKNNSKIGRARALCSKGLFMMDKGNLDTTLILFGQSNELLKELGKKSLEANGYVNVGGVWIDKGDTKVALSYFNKALEIYKSRNNIVKIAYVYLNIGSAYRQDGSLRLASEQYFNALEFLKQEKNHRYQARAYNSLGVIFNELGNHDKAIEYYKESIRIKEKLNNPTEVAITQLNIGSAYADAGNYENALRYFQMALLHFRSVKFKTGIAATLTDVAKVYVQQKKYNEGLKVLNEAAPLAEELNNAEGVVTVLNAFGKIFLNQGNYSKALTYASKAREKSIRHNIQDQLGESNHLLADIYENMGLTKESYSYYKKYVQVKDSLLNKKNLVRIFDIEKQFEVNKKQSEIDLLSEKNKVKELELAHERNLKYAFLAGAILLLVAVGFAYYGFRTKVKLSNQLEEKYHEIKTQKELIESINYELKAQALRTNMNPHFVFNALNSIQYLIFNNFNEEAFKYLSKFSVLLRKVLESSDKNAVSIKEEIETLELYLELEALRFDGGISYKIESDDQGKSTTIPPMMIQPFVENAIVHGLIHKKTDRKLDIKLLTDQNKIVCHIIDNGIGREAAAKIRSKKNLSYKSVGIQLTKQRFAIQNALMRERSFCSISDLVDEAGNPIGTHVTLTFDRTN